VRVRMAMGAGVDTLVEVEAEAKVPGTEEGEVGKIHLHVSQWNPTTGDPQSNMV